MGSWSLEGAVAAVVLIAVLVTLSVRNLVPDQVECDLGEPGDLLSVRGLGNFADVDLFNDFPISTRWSDSSALKHGAPKASGTTSLVSPDLSVVPLASPSSSSQRARTRAAASAAGARVGASAVTPSATDQWMALSPEARGGGRPTASASSSSSAGLTALPNATDARNGASVAPSSSLALLPRARETGADQTWAGRSLHTAGRRRGSRAAASASASSSLRFPEA